MPATNTARTAALCPTSSATNYVVRAADYSDPARPTGPHTVPIFDVPVGLSAVAAARQLGVACLTAQEESDELEFGTGSRIVAALRMPSGLVALCVQRGE